MSKNNSYLQGKYPVLFTGIFIGVVGMLGLERIVENSRQEQPRPAIVSQTPVPTLVSTLVPTPKPAQPTLQPTQKPTSRPTPVRRTYHSGPLNAPFGDWSVYSNENFSIEHPCAIDIHAYAQIKGKNIELEERWKKIERVSFEIPDELKKGRDYIDIFAVDKKGKKSGNMRVYVLDNALSKNPFPPPSEEAPRYDRTDDDSVWFEDDNIVGARGIVVQGRKKYKPRCFITDNSISVDIPDELLDRKGTLEVYVIDRDGNESEKVKIYTMEGLASRQPFDELCCIEPM